MKIYGIYSAGGFAREIKSSLKRTLDQKNLDEYSIVFIDDNPEKLNKNINNIEVISYSKFLEYPEKEINVAFADPLLRKNKVDIATNDGISFFDIIAPSFIKGDNVEIGEGAIFTENTMVTCDAIIGKHFHCNIYSYVAHDCIVGDFVTFAPRVSLNGRIRVENNVYIGSDVTFLPGNPDKFLTVGEGAVIGAGAVVTKDVEPGSTMVGAPAKPR